MKTLGVGLVGGVHQHLVDNPQIRLASLPRATNERALDEARGFVRAPKSPFVTEECLPEFLDVSDNRETLALRWDTVMATVNFGIAER